MYIMEIRAINTLKLIETKEIKNRKKYEKTCMKMLKLVIKHHKKSENDELLLRVKSHSFIIKNGNYGYVIGIKEPKSRWL